MARSVVCRGKLGYRSGISVNMQRTNGERRELVPIARKTALRKINSHVPKLTFPLGISVEEKESQREYRPCDGTQLQYME